MKLFWDILNHFQAILSYLVFWEDNCVKIIFLLNNQVSKSKVSSIKVSSLSSSKQELNLWNNGFLIEIQFTIIAIIIIIIIITIIILIIIIIITIVIGRYLPNDIAISDCILLQSSNWAALGPAHATIFNSWRQLSLVFILYILE